ncbi:MAG: hypothetical protein PUK83_02355 [Clostridia bacterium]|nr:hypothetical protein [Clostridia bacterium]MDY5263706.1 hypothetical protein [Eubacteriales bacterium]
MQYTIHGFNQAEAVKLGLNNDDLLILRWFVDFTPSLKIKSCLINGKPYYWINYGYLLECLPILHKKPRALASDNIQRLLNSNVLKREIRLNAPEIEHKSGKTAWFGFGENYEQLISDIFLPDQVNKNVLDQVNKNRLDQVNKNVPDYSNIDSSNINKCVPRVRANAEKLQPIISLISNLSIDSKTIPANFDATKVAEAIKKSNKFLINVKKLSFFLAHYDDILKGVFDDYGKVKDAQAIVRRNYSKEQLAEMFPEIDNFDDLDF